MSEQANIETVKTWVGMLSHWGDNPDDIQKVLDLMDPDCDWYLMASGEHAKGRDAIAKMAAQSMTAVKHKDGHQLELTSLFGSGDLVCLEYLHKALITFPGKTESTAIEMPICIVFVMKDGKIAQAREYYEVEQLLGPGNVKPVYQH